MPTGVEDATTIWVNVGSAAGLVGATIGATFVGAVAIMKGLEDDDLVDADARAQQTGQELQNGGQRTRLRAEDVLAAQEKSQRAAQESPVQPPK